MNDHPKFPWDHFSDQPRTLKDKLFKRALYLRGSLHYLSSVLLLVLMPFFLLPLWFKKKTKIGKTNHCLGLSVHVETECEGKHIVPLTELESMVEELGVKQVLVRIPLADIDRLDHYLDHIKMLAANDREIVVNLLQSRIVLDDQVHLEKVVRLVVEKIKDTVKYIQVGNAYNRRKWAFRHFGEYFTFFKSVRSICNELAPEMKLIGGSVIDFEMLSFLESLFHFRKGQYDGYATQLYVDRRGAPENKQGGFDFLSKINLIEIMHRASWKSKGDLWLTEFNWPLKETGRFTPCYGDEQVEEQIQADYLTRAYLLAMASGKIRACYWHQLVAPGYGLVDNRGEKIRKRPSYYAFKALNELLNVAELKEAYLGGFQSNENLYCLEFHSVCEGKNALVLALWSSEGEIDLNNIDIDYWLNQSGNRLNEVENKPISINGSVTYGVKLK